MNILFAVNFAFPTGEASSIRALNLVRLLDKCGYKVHVIADYKGEFIDNVPCTYEFAGIKPKTLKDRKDNANKSIDKIKKYLVDNKVDFILTNAKYDRCNKILEISKEKNVKVIIESCEWYNYENFKFKLLDYRFWLNQKMILQDFKKATGFISISRLLNEQNSRLSKSIRIPTILDVCNSPYKEKIVGKDKIQIVYTGNPGKSKELLSPMIELLADNEFIRNNFLFDIYGVNLKQALKNKGVTKKKILNCKDSLNIHGRLSQIEIQDIILNADYQLFIRPNRKSSNAGFPTKLGESMCAGTPIITNDTGDISLYLKNEENGYILEGTEKKDLEKVLYKILETNEIERQEMRKNARKTAEDVFEYKNYANMINEFLRNLGENNEKDI